MTERQLFEFYLICIFAAFAGYYFAQHWLGGIGGFVGAALVQTFDSETRKRP